jgi:hypothetical protein
MKNILIVALVMVFSLMTSCKKDEVRGSSTVTSEYRDVSSFNKVRSDGIFQVTITQGSSQSVEIVTNQNIQNKVNTNVVDNELRLSLDEDYNYDNVTLHANIHVPNLYGIRNNGAGNITVFNVDNDGDFNVRNSGSGDISIEGIAQSLTLENEGSGEFEGFLFPVDDCSIEIHGSGDCRVNVANSLYVEIEGSGDVYYLGSPSIEADITGSGSIIDAN